MLDKINKILVNIVSFVLIVLSLALPILTLSSPNGDIEFKSKTLFGFHLLIGYSIKENNQFYQVVVSSYKAMILFLLPVTIFVIDKLVKKDIGKYLFNFIFSGISFVFFLLLSFKAQNYLNSNYYGALEFESLPCLYLIISLYFVYFALFTIILIVKVKQKNNELNEKTALKEDEIKEQNNY